jgi:hypothetical protein
MDYRLCQVIPYINNMILDDYSDIEEMALKAEKALCPVRADC